MTNLRVSPQRHCEPTGWRKAPPDDRLREATQSAVKTKLDCFLPMTYGSAEAVTRGRENRLAPRTAELRRQLLHRARHVAPLRHPRALKTARQIGPADAALAQAHAGCGGFARAARDDIGRIGEKQIFV